MSTPKTTSFLKTLQASLQDDYNITDQTDIQTLSVFQALPAVHKSSNRPVMIHVLNSDTKAADTDELSAQLRQLTTINHHQLPEIFDIGTLEVDGQKRPYLIMRHPGEATPLSGYLRDPKLTTENVVILIRSMIKMVGYLHQHGFRSFDLRPDHFAVGEDGDIKLLTLGIPTSAQNGSFTAASSPTAHPCFELSGTQSDSQLLSKKSALSTYIDVYSLGQTIEMLLTFICWAVNRPS